MYSVAKLFEEKLQRWISRVRERRARAHLTQSLASAGQQGLALHYRFKLLRKRGLGVLQNRARLHRGASEQAGELLCLCVKTWLVCYKAHTQ